MFIHWRNNDWMCPAARSPSLGDDLAFEQHCRHGTLFVRDFARLWISFVCGLEQLSPRPGLGAAVARPWPGAAFGIHPHALVCGHIPGVDFARLWLVRLWLFWGFISMPEQITYFIKCCFYNLEQFYDSSVVTIFFCLSLDLEQYPNIMHGLSVDICWSRISWIWCMACPLTTTWGRSSFFHFSCTY